ncbi:MAG: molybdate ABC transporter permease subunit [Blastocatellia bacterium]|nr:molybdate ABC transporter permease subunit [Blastocatellia bacterium]
MDTQFLDFYQSFFTVDWFPVRLSIFVATLATLLSIFLSLSISYLLARKNFFGKELLDAFISLPLVLPPTVLGYYLLVTLGPKSIIGRCWEAVFTSPLTFTWQAAVIAATIHALPLMIKSLRVAIENVPSNVENAARLLGASETKVFFTITLPLIWQDLLAATALAFARAMGDFGVTIMIAGNLPGRTQTAAIAIYDAVEAGRDNQALALVVVVSLLSVAMLYFINYISRKR